MFNNAVLFQKLSSFTLEHVTHLSLICLFDILAPSLIIVDTKLETSNAIVPSTYIRDHGYTLRRRCADPRRRCRGMVSASRCDDRCFDSTWNQDMDLSQASQR